MVELSESYLKDAYEVRLLSTYQIAEETDTYPNKVRRALRKYKITLRDKSDAQSTAIKSGRHKHPTKGKKRSEEIKIKISEGMARVWERMTDTEKERRVDLAKKQWADMTFAEQTEFKNLAVEGVRIAAVEGSKLEKYLLGEFRKNRVEVNFHAENVVMQERLQVDLLLPAHRIAIEIDGPAHFYPIWGEENLAKRLLADNTKTGLLIQKGFLVIRVKYLSKSLSNVHQRRIFAKIMEVVNNSVNNFEPKLIEIEMR